MTTKANYRVHLRSLENGSYNHEVTALISIFRKFSLMLKKNTSVGLLQSKQKINSIL
jgi:hypothetical protein